MVYDTREIVGNQKDFQELNRKYVQILPVAFQRFLLLVTEFCLYNAVRSTMPIKSSVQTPELFKGTLKEYQLKGLQWLVNCYEQVLGLD